MQPLSLWPRAIRVAAGLVRCLFLIHEVSLSIADDHVCEAFLTGLGKGTIKSYSVEIFKSAWVVLVAGCFLFVKV